MYYKRILLGDGRWTTDGYVTITVCLHKTPVIPSPWNIAYYVMITVDRLSPSMIKFFLFATRSESQQDSKVILFSLFRYYFSLISVECTSPSWFQGSLLRQSPSGWRWSRYVTWSDPITRICGRWIFRGKWNTNIDEIIVTNSFSLIRFQKIVDDVFFLVVLGDGNFKFRFLFRFIIKFNIVIYGW